MMRFLVAISLVVCLLSLTFFGCQSKEQGPPETEVKMTIISPAFGEGDIIPIKFTCDGENVSPALEWSDPPLGTGSLAIIMDDPDAPGRAFTHWLVFNIPSDVRGLIEAVPASQKLESGALQGKNDFGKNGYGGPCPPSGLAHQYRFTLYALDKTLDLKAGIVKEKLLDAMDGHIVAYGQLTVDYKR